MQEKVEKNYILFVYQTDSNHNTKLITQAPLPQEMLLTLAQSLFPFISPSMQFEFLEEYIITQTHHLLSENSVAGDCFINQLPEHDLTFQRITILIHNEYAPEVFQTLISKLERFSQQPHYISHFSNRHLINTQCVIYVQRQHTHTQAHFLNYTTPLGMQSAPFWRKFFQHSQPNNTDYANSFFELWDASSASSLSLLMQYGVALRLNHNKLPKIWVHTNELNAVNSTHCTLLYIQVQDNEFTKKFTKALDDMLLPLSKSMIYTKLPVRQEALSLYQHAAAFLAAQNEELAILNILNNQSLFNTADDTTRKSI